jgi:hypothetical protein
MIDVAGTFTTALKDPGEREQQSASGIIGPSDLSGCSKQVKYILEKYDQGESRYWLAAQMGTAFHAMLKEIALANEEWIAEHHMAINLGGRVIWGTADLIIPEANAVVDHKTTANLDWVKKHGPDPKHINQVHLYAMGAAQAGLIDRDAPMMGCLLYWDRSGIDQEPYEVWFDIQESICDDLADKYAFIVEHPLEEVPREEALPTCLNLCPFVRDCRAYFFEEPNVSDDPDVISAIDELQLIKDEVKALDIRKKELEGELTNIPSGKIGGYNLKWVHVSEAEIPSFTRRGYSYPRIQKVRVK